MPFPEVPLAEGHNGPAGNVAVAALRILSQIRKQNIPIFMPNILQEKLVGCM